MAAALHALMLLAFCGVEALHSRANQEPWSGLVGGEAESGSRQMHRQSRAEEAVKEEAPGEAAAETLRPASEREASVGSADVMRRAGEERRKSSVVKRTIQYPGSDLEFGGREGPFCYDRYVTGNCRYRTDPEYCYQYEWTAYAIVQNLGGGVQSEPPGLLVEAGNQERVRVWIKTSCCLSYVKIISIDAYNRDVNACVVDVRELQGLHPAEIAGIVIGVLLLLIIIVLAIVFLIRRRNSGLATVDNDCQVKSYGYNMRPATTPQAQPQLNTRTK